SGFGARDYDPRYLEVRLNERLYERYANVQRPWALQASEDIEFVFNGHWTQEQVRILRERRQQPISIPANFQTVSQAVAMRTANDPAFQAVAVGDEDAAMAHVISQLMAYGWQKSGARSHLRRAVFDAYVTARGVMMAYVDP